MPKAEKIKKVTKVDKQIHPKSRKASQLSKAAHHEDRRQKRKDEYDAKQTTLKNKVKWFKEHLDDGKEKYSLSEVTSIISSYIDRFDDRLKEIAEQNEFNKTKSRHGRYHAAEEEGIKMVRERQLALFKTGKFEAPDLTNVRNVKLLRNWDGEVKQLANIKIREFKEPFPGTSSSMES